MWSDNDIDNAFRRLDPAEPEPTPFPLDAWLKLEAGLDQAVIDRAVRRRLWQFFAAEVAVVALVGLGWSLWPAGSAVSVNSKSQTTATADLPAGKSAADAKYLMNARVSGANTAVAPTNRPETGSARVPMSRPAAEAATGTTTSIEAPVNNAATGTIVVPGRAAVGRGPHPPLAAALTPSRHSTENARSHSIDDRLTASGNDAAALVEPTAGLLESKAAPRKATSESNGRLLAIAAPTAKSQISTSPVFPERGGTSPETTGHTASSPMVAPSRVASEVAVADAASHGFGAAGAAPNAHHGVVTPESNGNEIITDSPGTTSAPLQTAAAGSLAPVAAAIVEPASIEAKPLPTTLALTELTPVPLPTVMRQPRLYVGLVAAPDVSTVKFADVQAPRLNVGLTLEYRLGQRWRVATGVQRSMKEYYARREDYDWANYPRAQTRDFSWVEGQCTVIDVPLNLRYDAVVQAHARWFGTAGLSSFFMQRENYSYDYLEGGTYKPWDMPSLVNANRHLFSVLNLSAGYEYGLGTHWRLQAEPYVKVPLAGVGAGKVKLLSAGFYFGVKYGF